MDCPAINFSAPAGALRIAVSLSFLQKRGYTTVEPESLQSKVKVVVLTGSGQKAYNTCCGLLSEIEEHWHVRFGTDVIRSLRESLEQLVGEPTAQESPLFAG
ncbi:MAG: hypothetical protein M3Y24_11515 [Acidobacteriota bacterium]|nr:hypothetical protein [Acidobacteriota bacterium]